MIDRTIPAGTIFPTPPKLRYPEELLAERVEELNSLTECLTAQLEDAEAENARFRNALEFYADDYPFGNEARKALGVV